MLMKNSDNTIGNQARYLPALAQCLNQLRHQQRATQLMTYLSKIFTFKPMVPTKNLSATVTA
jgi:hypothetical protein